MHASKTVGALIALALAAPLASGTHVVRPGDTLSRIARNHGTTVAAIASTNGIHDVNRIFAGQVLLLGGGPTPPAPGPGAERSHTITRGETLSHIAAAYGTTVSAIAGANGVTNTHLVVAGTRLSIPGVGPSSAASATTVTVAAGDTLTSIAAAHGVSAVELAAHNQLANPNLIRIGQKLAIPAANPAGPAAGAFPSRLLARPERLALIPLFDRWAGEYGVPHELLKAMTWLESGWQNHVVSSSGATGIGQLMPDTVNFVGGHLLGTPLDPANPEHNIRMSARFLRYLLDQTGGDQSLALAAYYQGLRAVRERGVYPSTLSYVGGVLSFRDTFSWR